MDGGFRSPRSTERQPAARPAATYSQPEPVQPQPIVEAPRAEHRAPAHHTKEKAPKRRAKWIIIAAIVVVLAAGGWSGWSYLRGGAPAIDGGKYQAVFFTNGQVYFGKLHPINSNYLKLTDIYYLQTQSTGTSGSDSSNPQKASSSDQNNVQLVKLGNEIHGPEDEMVIARDQVLFYENLKPSGKVSQTIQKAQSSGKF